MFTSENNTDSYEIFRGFIAKVADSRNVELLNQVYGYLGLIPILSQSHPTCENLKKLMIQIVVQLQHLPAPIAGLVFSITN
jgi:hypothetical protein